MIANNCTTVIAALLEIGSGVTPSFQPSIKIDDHIPMLAMRVLLKIRYLNHSLKMWSPNQLLKYANEINVRPRR